MKRVAIVSMACASLTMGALSSGAAAAKAPIPPCSAQQYHQFDFWSGTWEVRDPKGQLQGTNEVTKIQDGCVLQEHWKGADGSAGTSFNVYYAGDKKWHQTWVDNQGGLLVLDGGLVNGAMVLSGTRTMRTGKTSVERITWSKMSGGRVRQVWDRSLNGGKTWSNVFDGIYARLGRA